VTRINYTGRRHIERDQVKLRLRRAENHFLLDVVQLNLDDLGLPRDATIVIEAYRQTGYMRFDAGTVGVPKLPSGLSLSEFQSPEGVLFRVKIADQAVGKLLATADRLRALIEYEAPAPTESMLPIRPERLGHELWHIDLSEDEPTLVVNSEVGDWKTFSLRPVFQAFVLPEVVRQIGLWVISNKTQLDDDGDSALSLWAAYMRSLGYDPAQAPGEDSGEWVNDMVQDFCRQHRFRDLIPELTGEIE
jgi:hypothetical protein